MSGKADVRDFSRIVRTRSTEHRRAIQLLSNENLFGQMTAVLRQELDSMIRVIFLLKLSDIEYRDKLIGSSLRGERWRHVARKKPIADREMVDLAQKLEGWTESVYKFGCAFIHLSAMHDYAARDPFRALDASERKSILQHLRTYHSAPDSDDAGFSDIAPLIPRVFEKIASNLDCYLRELEQDQQITPR